MSANRQYVMEEYNLESDPCDYRLIRINNCIQMLSCCCSILAMIDENFRHLSQLVNHVADLVYHSVSGCMTAQVAFEIDFQESREHSNCGVSDDAVYSPMTTKAVLISHQVVVPMEQKLSTSFPTPIPQEYNVLKGEEEGRNN